MPGWRLTGGNGRGVLNGVPLQAHDSTSREPVAAVLPFPLPHNVVPIGHGRVLKARRQHKSYTGSAA